MIQEAGLLRLAPTHDLVHGQYERVHTLVGVLLRFHQALVRFNQMLMRFRQAVNARRQLLKRIANDHLAA